VSILYTIGHSNHCLEKFLELLNIHKIEVLVDVRSQPSSRFSPHFNQDNLKTAIRNTGAKYLFMGEQLGGRPKGKEFYDLDGHVLYGNVAQSIFFREGIARLCKGLQRFRIAIMCSEEDPAICHRTLLISRVLDGKGIDIMHIRGNGLLTKNENLKTPTQVNFFNSHKRMEWKSIQSVSPKKLPDNSSTSSKMSASGG
jgi:uncharacterized protein (DUF488 family)